MYLINIEGTIINLENVTTALWVEEIDPVDGLPGLIIEYVDDTARPFKGSSAKLAYNWLCDACIGRFPEYATAPLEMHEEDDE